MSTSEGLRVGFVGSGWSDRVQIPVFRLGGLTPQAIASANPENAQRVAAAHQLPETYATWQELVASESVDIVSICTPPHLHAEIAIAALAAGKHVICEKPTALNVNEAEAMLAAAQAAPGRLAIIDHELRFHPQRLHMRQLIKEGYIGSVLQARFDRLGSERLDAAQPWTWWSDAARGGGMLGALGSHLIDLARWMIGRIEAVAAQLQIGHLYRHDPQQGFQRQVTADDHADLLLRFVNGALGSITVSGITPGGYGMSILVVGAEGALMLDNQDRLFGMKGVYPGGEWEPLRPKANLPTVEGLPNQGAFTVGSYYLAQTLAMSLPMGETMLDDAASFYDGLVVQRVLDAARRAHQTRTWQAL
ncbi:MAG TPA: gfo/Idh/MocA family oxidoreductase [Chloroflexi bacterium]|nr:gfo/Idh/MocA family oxidoreductase [Chloroflexota bacterium]HHW88516.1 Gfo/Idh/MocA family oxidoreductase [Chloroflexota bacterium]